MCGIGRDQWGRASQGEAWIRGEGRKDRDVDLQAELEGEGEECCWCFGNDSGLWGLIDLAVGVFDPDWNPAT